VAQPVEHLLCKPEALNSNPSPTKKKKKIRLQDGNSLQYHPKKKKVKKDSNLLL
jgi:hypothetical protein